MADFNLGKRLFIRAGFRLFGEDGFEKMAQRVAKLEQAMGINDLNQFTPH